mgnify:CR=1 FL=1
MSQPSKKRAKRTKTIRRYAKFSGLAYQMIGLVAVSVFLGLKADKYYGNEDSKYITVVLVIIVFAAFMYRLYIILIKDKAE